uniref:Protein kinase domain-containing protein n=1 Tax=Salix viminalis TaxID=40686 RepID=A0A6N2KMT5_SALVM
MSTATAIFLFFFFISATIITYTQCDAVSLSEEIQALTSFKLNLNDPLGALDGWDVSTQLAPCDWHGIVCYNNRVHELRSLNFLALSVLSLLRAVYLQSNSLSGNLPSTIVNLTNLQFLNVAHNFLSGKTSGYLSDSLRYLDISSNSFSGEIPGNFSSKSQLQLINLSYNKFSGEVPASIGQLQELEYLWLDSNQLYGTLPSAIANCSSLVHLSIEDNSLKGYAVWLNPTEKYPLSCLWSFEEAEILFEYSRNHITRVSSCCCLTTVRVVDFSRNLFSGSLPSGIGNLSRLEEFRVANNSLTGDIPNHIVKCGFLQVLDLEGNREEIMRLTNLSTLDLSFNKFYGEIPYNIGDLKGLMVLNLSACGFSGRIPASIGSLLKLITLDLSKQNLSGELPIEIFGLPSLQVLALEENKLSGAVPEGFSSLVSLQYLNLTSNSFTGEVPVNYGFLVSLAVFSLSRNYISGMIPAELCNCSSLEVLELRSNHLRGSIPGDISRLKLDLGENALTGEIPANIYRCSPLISLSLDANHLSGHIPESLSKLSNLTVLNLSSNSLNGTIPANLSYIPSLRYLNLSRNNLEGEIPKLLGSRFNDPSVFAVNGKLCGSPVDRECAGVKNRKRKKLFLFIGVPIAATVLLALCCCAYIYSLLRWRSRLKDGVTGEKKRSPARASSGADRSRGSGENGGPKLFDEDNVLSRGRYGLVFKASYQDGMVLSVRRLPDASISAGNFRKEAESLGKLKHRNLTVLRGYYAGPPDVRLLKPPTKDGHVLNWPMRHLIAVGIARGLAFLHSLSMIHGDVKPQNVLFDADFEAHLSEFGLDKLTIATPAEASSSSTPMGSLGYLSPEVALTGQPTKEADVYSFGIVLLEILTGRKPVMFTQDEDIVKWVKKQLQRGQISELLEPGLLELDPESSEWEEFLLGIKVGLLCTAPDPLDRPSMADIVFMLEGCRAGPDIPSSLPSPV